MDLFHQKSYSFTILSIGLSSFGLDMCPTYKKFGTSNPVFDQQSYDFFMTFKPLEAVGY